MPTMTEADRAFHEPWWAKLQASYASGTQREQNRLLARYAAACHARDAVQRQARDEADAEKRRAVDAARKRAERARARATIIAAAERKAKG